jgi:hydroxymethylglutaryl-CoA reductase
MDVPQRLGALLREGLITETEFQTLSRGEQVLDLSRADKMIENVIGVMGLPIGLAMNFLINNQEYVIPMVVEEPSIVAALSSAAKIARTSGGFTASATDPILVGQIQVLGVKDPARAQAAVLQRKEEILDLANSLHPKMVARGGGAVDIEVYVHPSPDGGRDMVVVHLLVDTRDAMGANLVNTMCEGVATLVENITDGRVLMRILSNLSDRALASARMVLPTEALATKTLAGEQVRDAIIAAGALAVVDPYRATTHNKGVMNGVDAVAIATGNDWRALESAAHAYAARGKSYTSLTSWTADADGNLVGAIEMPMKVGTVGGSLMSNPAVKLNHQILGVKSATELAQIMAAVGLAQNFSALKALATDGIQQGHMTLHARSVTATAGADADIFDQVVERLLDDGEIKVWKAREIIDELRSVKRAAPSSTGRVPRPESDFSVGYGKVILLGEHSVVYGRHAIATPLRAAIKARVEDADEGLTLIIPRWGVEQKLHPESGRPGSFLGLMNLVLGELGLSGRAMRIHVQPDVPRAVGLGSSAALSVAIVRAVDTHFRIGLTDEQVCRLAYECEKIAHGTPSGVDNTVATYGQTILFQRTDADAAVDAAVRDAAVRDAMSLPASDAAEDAAEVLHATAAGAPTNGSPAMRTLSVPGPLPIVIGLTGTESLTAKTVAKVRERWQQQPALYEGIFDTIDSLTLAAVDAVEAGRFDDLGELMNICQGQLNALQVSSPQIEDLVQVARRAGAVGAKLTGGGGGGAIVALCPDGGERVAAAMREARYEALLEVPQ